MGEDAVAMSGDDAADQPPAVIAATAVSRKQTVLAEVNRDGYVCGVRLLAASTRTWDADTLETRIKAVAAVAHDRYLAGLPATHAVYPTLDDVADAESGLDF
jgi:hypothetical protein